jgi:hypothetical protein
VTQQVKALYDTLKKREIRYVNSVLDYGMPTLIYTQRTRLPRESLALKSANCIDGAVLFASLLEGITLNAALILIPGHAIVAWETNRNTEEWNCLETVMIGTHNFEQAHATGQEIFQLELQKDKKKVKILPINKLRREPHNIWPME